MNVDRVLTPDLIKGNLLVTIYGKQIVIIENYKSIIGYNESEIRLQAKENKLLIHGRKLEIERFGNTDCKVVGEIESLEYVSE